MIIEDGGDMVKGEGLFFDKIEGDIGEVKGRI